MGESMSLDLIEFSKRLIKNYSRYFGLQGKNFYRTLAVLGILLCNISLAVVFLYFNSSMTALFAVLELPVVTYSAFIEPVAVVCGYLGLSVGISLLKNQFIPYLRGSLSKAVDKTMLKRWIKNKAYYGIKFLFKNEKEKKEADVVGDNNPAQIMSEDNSELINSSITLIDDFVSKLFLCGAGIMGLYTLSQPLILSFYAMSFTIPGYLAIGAILYAGLYRLMTSTIGKPLKEKELATRKAQGELYQKGQYIADNADAIALLKGKDYEYNSLKVTLADMGIVKAASAKIRLALQYLTNLNWEIGYYVPIVLSIPNVIAGKMKLSAVYEVIPNFLSVVDLFTFKDENYDELAKCEVSLMRIEKLNQQLTLWEKACEKNRHNKLEYTRTKNNHSSSDITFKNITLLKPDGTRLLENLKFTLTKGRVTLLQGPSGCGKSTLLRAIADQWPYLKKGGKIVYSGKSLTINFIPQQAFIYHRGKSLLETILYPQSRKVSEIEIKRIKSMMRKCKLKEATIQNLLLVKDWSKELSGGEKQRIAIISAILKKPDVLFMDEATSAIDKRTKLEVEKLIKDELPNTAIGYIDHNPSNEAALVSNYLPLKKKAAFHDNEVVLKPIQQNATRFRRAV